MPPTEDGAHYPGMCPEWGIQNQGPLDSWVDAQLLSHSGLACKKNDLTENGIMKWDLKDDFILVQRKGKQDQEHLVSRPGRAVQGESTRSSG